MAASVILALEVGGLMLCLHCPLDAEPLKMNEDWSAIVNAEEGEDGLFVPVLMLFAPDEDEPLRIPLHGVYRTAIEAVEAGRLAISAMASE